MERMLPSSCYKTITILIPKLDKVTITIAKEYQNYKSICLNMDKKFSKKFTTSLQEYLGEKSLTRSSWLHSKAARMVRHT